MGYLLRLLNIKSNKQASLAWCAPTTSTSSVRHHALRIFLLEDDCDWGFQNQTKRADNAVHVDPAPMECLSYIWGKKFANDRSAYMEHSRSVKVSSIPLRWTTAERWHGPIRIQPSLKLADRCRFKSKFVTEIERIDVDLQIAQWKSCMDDDGPAGNLCL
jgi:hypothetical protein